MRQMIKDFVEICSKNLPITEPIYEFGSFQVPGQEVFADLRPYFPGKEYVGCDMRMGPGVDRVLNLHHIDLPDESVGTVLSLDTFEHVEYPRKAIHEIHRILRPGGVCVISSVMNFIIHDYPHDYWRFTPQGFSSLLEIFPTHHVDWAGEPYHPHTVVGVAIKGPGKLEELKKALMVWKQQAYIQY
jgi:SAM-dependent methyltransferase